MNEAKGTLVKSRPELWQMLDQPERMLEWSVALLEDEVEIEVTKREDGELLCWTAAVASEATSIEVALEESGWGTKVLLSAEGPRSLDDFQAWAKDLFEELGSPSRRPFSRGEYEPAPKAAARPEAPAQAELEDLLEPEELEPESQPETPPEPGPEDLLQPEPQALPEPEPEPEAPVRTDRETAAVPRDEDRPPARRRRRLWPWR